LEWERVSEAPSVDGWVGELSEAELSAGVWLAEESLVGELSAAAWSAEAAAL
jgi:hypothetical protein